MARRSENECAYCAEEVPTENSVIGTDWKVYCSAACAVQGQQMSSREMQELMRAMVPSRDTQYTDLTP